MTQKRRKRRTTATGAVFLLRIVILILITWIMLGIGKRRLTEAVTSDQYPSAQQQYAQTAEEKGSFRAVQAILDGEEADAEAGKVVKKPVKQPVTASYTLPSPVAEAEEAGQPETELIEFNKPLFRGKILKIKDPSRVYVGVAGPLGTPTSCGKHIPDMVEEYGAIAAVNANGFVDPNGMGNGGQPVGIIISQGNLCFGDPYSYYDLCGFDNNGKLHCGWMTGQEALNLGIRDCACFGPTLIKDGVKQDMTGMYGGYNPRTVIGQLEDGTVMILLIEGRMFCAIGITYPQLCDFCAELGMVNAGNMDGGASSVMYYEGKQNTIVSTLYGARLMPNCWLVAPES